ncbi:MAG TPA: translocation/assembly module TamB domain-containing protein [Pyrinomonadaceae bacterium]|jgi:translocation and assembly module TamB
MPVDDRDEHSSASSPENDKSNIRDALQSEGDAPLPPAAERIAERDADRPEPLTPQGRRRRFLTRRNAFIATLALAVGVVVLILVGVVAYRLGYIDRYIANQIKDTLAQYGIRADIKEFHTAFGPRTVEMRDIQLYDQQTGEKLGKVDRMLAKVRISDLYALSLRRNINLEELDIDGLEVWVKFDAEGNSNFRNIHLPPPDPNQRILFAYSTAKIRLNSAIVHYGDVQHDLSGEARNLVATVEPEDPNAPEASRMNRVVLSSTNSTFVYDGSPAVNNIDITARGSVNQTRADIQELTLRSPVAEARLSGTMDDWREFRYRMKLDSMIDLTQASDILQPGMALRGVGNLSGTISGEGSKYVFDGDVKSDALAADGVRLQALNANAKVSGEGKSYEANGRAVAELLTAGDFQLNMVQLTGGVMGTGTDFRWLGELRAAAARSPDGSVAGLVLSDVAAESRDKVLTYSASRLTASRLNASGATVGGLQATGLHGRTENGVTTATVASVQAGTIQSSGARVGGLSASGVSIVARDNATTIETDALRVGSLNAGGAQVGSLNIAGVRLAIRDGRVQGSSGDINAGTVTLAKSRGFEGGRVDNVRLSRPVFTVERGDRYRVSADLSLGGGVLGQINLGAARASVVATNSQVQLNNFNADILGGRAAGNATVSTARGGASRIAAEFSNLDIGKLVSTVSARVIPVAGKATGTINLSFPGTNVGAASGTARATFTGETGDDASGRTPLSGEVALRADRGLFDIERANLRTAASELNASGQFSIARDESNLQLALASSNAAELQQVLVSTGLLPDVETQLERNKIELAGNLTFNGTVRGRLKAPSIDGRAALDSLMMNGRDLGAIAANITTTPDELRITNGQLTERDGGGMQFALTAPFNATNNISINATLDRVNAGNLSAALAVLSPKLAGLGVESEISGKINVSGLPDAMSGDAELRFGAGRISNEPFQSILARASFNGSIVTLQTVEARLNAGLITASGTVNLSNQALDLQARATGIQLERLSAFAPRAGALPRLTGLADLNASIRGTLSENDFSNFEVNFDGQGRDVTVNGRPAGTLSLVGRTENRQLNVSFTTGLLGNQQQVIAARVDLSRPELPAVVETTLTGTDLTRLFQLVLPETDVRVTGTATGTLRASGNLITENAEGETEYGLGGLSGTANFTDLTVQIEDIQLRAVSPLLVQFSTSEVFFERTQFTGQDTNVTFGGRLALGPGGQQSLTIDGRLNLRVLNGLSPNVILSGTADAAVRVGGSFEQPRLTGTASLTGASIATFIGDERLNLTNVKGSVRFNSNLAQVESSGTLGGGRVTLAGGVLLAGFTPSRYQFSIHGEDVTVPYPEGFRSTADADLQLNGTTRGQIISGTVNLRRAEYREDIELATLINRRREASLTEGGGDSALGATTQLDLIVVGRDALVVRNNLADISGSVSLRVTGPLEDPIVSGRITATRGTLNFRNDRYEVQRAFIDLPAQRDADPILNIQVEGEVRGYTVVASLTGPLSQPSATVRSDPALPQADVVSLILTGNLASGDTSASTLAQSGLGTAASLLTERLINAPVQRATNRLFGLNRFEIDPLIAGRGGESPTARLTVGRQINRNLSITYSTNVTSNQNQVLALEYRVSNRLSFVAQYEQGSVSGLGSRNDNFSFEIRFRKRF